MTTENFSETIKKNVSDTMKLFQESASTYSEAFTKAIHSVENLNKEAGEKLSTEFKKSLEANTKLFHDINVQFETAVSNTTKHWSDLIKSFNPNSNGSVNKTRVNKETIEN